MPREDLSLMPLWYQCSSQQFYLMISFGGSLVRTKTFSPDSRKHWCKSCIVQNIWVMKLLAHVYHTNNTNGTCTEEDQKILQDNSGNFRKTHINPAPKIRRSPIFFWNFTWSFTRIGIGRHRMYRSVMTLKHPTPIATIVVVAQILVERFSIELHRVRFAIW